MNEFLFEGVEIISKTEIMTWGSWYISFRLFCLTIWIVLAVISIKCEDVREAVIALIITLISLLISATVKHSDIFKTVPTGEYEYVVKISEEADLTAFYEKYEVVSTDGLTYVVREINSNDTEYAKKLLMEEMGYDNFNTHDLSTKAGQ